MANGEWYSGTDTTGTVAAGIEAAIKRMDARAADRSEINKLGKLLTLEKDENWRSLILGLVGTIHIELDDVEAARRVLRESVAGYKVYLESFDGVINIYCQSCFRMAVILFKDEAYRDAIPYLLRCLPYQHEVYDDETNRADVFMLLHACLTHSGWEDMGLAFAEAAAYSRRCDCESLEELMVAYQNQDCIEQATEVYSLLSNFCKDYENIDRAIEYAKEHLTNKGTVN